MYLSAPNFLPLDESTLGDVSRRPATSVSPYRRSARMTSVADTGILQHLDARRSALTVAALATLLEISKKELYKLAAAGDIPHYRIRSAIRFCPGETAAWLRSRQCGEGR
jgi:excisionase family DNA binding protein